MSALAALVAGLAALLAIHGLALVVATRSIAHGIEAAYPPEGRFVPVPAGRLHVYDLSGPPDAADRLPVVLLHGATSNARDMVLALGPDLARRRRVLAIDRPGHGWSDRPGGRRDASPARQAALVAAALDALGIGRAVVVGYSLAGAVATSLALDHASRVAGLVLLAPVTHPWPGAAILWYYRLAARPILGRLFVRTVMAPLAAYGFARSVDGSFAPQPPRPGYAQASAAALVLRPDEFRWNAEDVAALHGFVAGQAGRYGAIRVPAAVLAGEADTVVHPGLHARPVAAAIPGGRLTLLPGVGHMPHHGATDVVVAEIERVATEAEGTREGQPREARHALPT